MCGTPLKRLWLEGRRGAAYSYVRALPPPAPFKYPERPCIQTHPLVFRSPLSPFTLRLQGTLENRRRKAESSLTTSGLAGFEDRRELSEEEKRGKGKGKRQRVSSQDVEEREEREWKGRRWRETLGRREDKKYRDVLLPPSLEEGEKSFSLDSP